MRYVNWVTLFTAGLIGVAVGFTVANQPMVVKAMASHIVFILETISEAERKDELDGLISNYNVVDIESPQQRCSQNQECEN